MSPPSPPLPGSPADWLRHARSDLAYARVDRPAEGLWEGLCFHAQQAAEKALKAVLVAQGVPVLKTHNLEALLALLPSSLVVPVDVQAAKVLALYAVETRYPGVAPPVDEAEYRQAVAHARAVVAWGEAVVAGSAGLEQP